MQASRDSLSGVAYWIGGVPRGGMGPIQLQVDRFLVIYATS